MAPVHDRDVSKSPEDLPCSKKHRAPRFSVEEAARRRANGFKPRAAGEIAKDVLVRNAETLKRLGE